MRNYIMLVVFSIGLVWYIVDIFRMRRNRNRSRNTPTDIEDLTRKYRSLYLEHKITMAVVFLVLILGYVETLCKN